MKAIVRFYNEAKKVVNVDNGYKVDALDNLVLMRADKIAFVISKGSWSSVEFQDDDQDPA